MTCRQLLLLLFVTAAMGADVLPGSSKLTIDRPVHEVMVEGINRYCVRLTAEARRQRRSGNIPERRKRFRELIGAVDARNTTAGHFNRLTKLENSLVVASSPNVTVHAVKWPTLDDVTGEGLLFKPKRIRAAVVALPDAGWVPEMFCGLADVPDGLSTYVHRLAESGCLVLVPALISRSHEFSKQTNQPHREYLYRQAFEVGRHPIGFEVQKVLAGIDLFDPSLPVGVAGVGEGGLLALYAAALDPRIDATLVSGYFSQRDELWREPIYRNVWRLLTEFGDADLAGLIAPRRLVIEACRVPEITGPQMPDGLRHSAAPGRIKTSPLASVRAEFQLLANSRETKLIASGGDGNGPAGSEEAVNAFAAGLGIELASRNLAKWEIVKLPDHRAREKRKLDELQDYVQRLLRDCHQMRTAKWKADRSSPESWIPTRDRLRDLVHEEMIGRLRLKPTAPNPRSRLVLENESYTGYEVVIDVAPDLIAGGVLLLPRDLKDGEQRPVVVCQHGLERTSMDTISREPRAYRSYKSFADQLCRRGFIVYAPQNPHIGGDEFRSIQRKANPLGLSLFSFIIEQHRQTLAWLAQLPNVDPERIAFYGLSYGGKTAMRVPPFLDGYCLSICSGDFTDWPHTIANNTERYSYVFTGEYEIPEWNLGHVASYAELAMLMSPRPFMVEAGRRDRGQPVELVAAEFEKVRRHYEQLGIGKLAELEFFDGPHTIHGQGTFRFLHRHLNWPTKRKEE